MIYLRFSGTDTTLSHLFLPDLRPYTNRHDLRKKSLAAKKQHLRHQQKKRISGRKTLQKRCKPPRNIHPDTLLIPFPCMKTGQAGQPDNRTTGQPDNLTTGQPDNPTTRQPDNRTNSQTARQTGKQTDKQANRQTTIHVRQAVRQIQGEKQVPKKEGKKKGETVRRHVSHKRKRGSGEAAYGVFDRFFQLREADHQVPAISL